MTLFDHSGKHARLISTLLLFVVFVAGALAGAAGERVLRADETSQPRPGPEMRGGTRRLLLDEQFARELQLDSAQRAQIRSIFERRDEQAKKIWHEAEPKLEAVGREARSEIERVLNDEQVRKLDAELARRHAAWKERHKCHDDVARPDTGLRK